MASQRDHHLTIWLTATTTALSISAAWWLFTEYRSSLIEKGSHPSPSSLRYKIPEQLLLSPYCEEVKLAVQLALKCGKNMYRYCDEKGTLAGNNHDLGINTKGQAENLCTKIDLENEQIIIERIKQKFPTHDIIGEESVGTGTIPRVDPNTPTWIIDPIDGTTNFVAGLPLTCVSIGLCIKEIPTVGVVYVPMTDEMYIGVVGYGCYRNGIPITKRNETKKTIKESVVCYEFACIRDPDGIMKMTAAVRKVLNNGCRTTRQFGSGVLDLCYVATGRLDIVYAGLAGEGWKPWDYCAGAVIAKEAGCSIQSFYQKDDDDEFDIYGDSVICSVNKSMINELRSLILPDLKR